MGQKYERIEIPPKLQWEDLITCSLTKAKLRLRKMCNNTAIWMQKNQTNFCDSQ